MALESCIEVNDISAELLGLGVLRGQVREVEEVLLFLLHRLDQGRDSRVHEPLVGLRCSLRFAQDSLRLFDIFLVVLGVPVPPVDHVTTQFFHLFRQLQRASAGASGHGAHGTCVCVGPSTERERGCRCKS